MTEIGHDRFVRRWLEIAVVVPIGAADVVADRLVENGAPGIREEDVDDERRRLVAHFSDESAVLAVERLLSALEPYFPGLARAPLESRFVDEEDWAEGWRQAFPPLVIGRRVRVRPPWEKPPDDGRADVVIEPAMAFGTGQHASTHGCLLALEEALAPGATALDVGTGSGILAIAAALLGADVAVGVDTDPIAVAAARENAARSAVADRAIFAVGGVGCVRGRFALVLANLYSGVLATILPDLAERLQPNGRLVLSGLLAADAAGLVERAAECRLVRAGSHEIDGWTTLVLRSR
jgi:ribosomal protein L11 methyltransferase